MFEFVYIFFSRNKRRSFSLNGHKLQWALLKGSLTSISTSRNYLDPIFARVNIYDTNVEFVVFQCSMSNDLVSIERRYSSRFYFSLIINHSCGVLELLIVVIIIIIIIIIMVY